MSHDSSFADLMTNLRAGNEDAAAQVFKQFAHRLIGLARSRIDRAFRPKMDADDVVQSVFRSFFVRQLKGEFQLEDWDSLWSLLTVLTLRKCGHRIEYFRAARRDLRREISHQPLSEDETCSWEAIARQPTPSEAAVLHETVEQMLRGLDKHNRRIVELCLQGFNAGDVSIQVGCSERTVKRLLARIKKRLMRQGVD